MDSVKKAIVKWSNEFEIEVNYKKSAIMQIRKDRRTPTRLESTLAGFPVVTEYKYLGVIIDDALNLEMDVKKKKSLEAQLRRASWIFKTQ